MLRFITEHQKLVRFVVLPNVTLAGQISTAILANMADADTPVTLRTRKFIRNPLLGRKQMVV
jgi:hypothetical protein